MRPILLSLALVVSLLAPSLARAMGGENAIPEVSAPQTFVAQAEAADINWRQSLVILIGNPDNDFATNLPYAERDLEAMRLYALEGLKVSPQSLHVFKNADSNAFARSAILDELRECDEWAEAPTSDVQRASKYVSVDLRAGCAECRQQFEMYNAPEICTQCRLPVHEHGG